MYYKNKIPTSLALGIQYRCGCKERIGQYPKQIYFGYEECMSSFEDRLLNAIQNNEFGEEWSEILREHPEGTVDSSIGLYKCDACGYWINEEKMDFYDVIKGEVIRRKSFHVNENKRKYQLYRRYEHICPVCRNRMREILNCTKAVEAANLVCPKCKRELRIEHQKYDEVEAVWEEGYHNVLLAMLSQAYMLDSYHNIISRLDEKIVLIDGKLVVSGMEEVEKYLYDRSVALAQNDSNKREIKHVEIKNIEYGLETCGNLWLIKRGVLVCAKGKELLESGHLGKDGLIKLLIFQTVNDCDYTILDCDYFGLRKI